MEKAGWKITAIIFMCLSVLSIGLIIFTFFLGYNAIASESECSNSICNNEKYDSYFYDDVTGICNCYNDNKLIYYKQIG